MRWLGGTDERPGWVKAPSTVEQEIRTVWLEDELPEELTSSPGYVRFTLGPEAQAWVDTMAEVVDGGKAVYGRPKPATPPAHRQLATPPPAPLPPPSVAPDIGRRPGGAIRAAPPARHVPMPEIGGPEAAPPQPAAEKKRTLPKRVVMPEIAERTPPPLMPEIGE